MIGVPKRREEGQPPHADAGPEDGELSWLSLASKESGVMGRRWRRQAEGISGWAAGRTLGD